MANNYLELVHDVLMDADEDDYLGLDVIVDQANEHGFADPPSETEIVQYMTDCVNAGIFERGPDVNGLPTWRYRSG